MRAGGHPWALNDALSSQLRGLPLGEGARPGSQVCRAQSEDGRALERRSETFGISHRSSLAAPLGPGAFGLDLTPLLPRS